VARSGRKYLGNSGADMQYMVLSALITLAGINREMLHVMEGILGIKRQTVVLENKPIVLRPPGITLRSKKPMKVIGPYVRVCLVLSTPARDGTPDQQVRWFKEAMHGVKVGVTFKTKEGSAARTDAVTPSWYKFSRISAKSEMDACFSPRHKGTFATGARMANIRVTVSAPLKVEGIYWESSNDD